MIKFLMITAALLVSNFLHADEIRKWKDENGKVHYGDPQNAPVNSQKVAISVSQPRNDLPDVQKAAKKEDASVVFESIEGISAEKIKLCASFARAMVDSRDKSEWMVNSVKVQQMCPGVGFKCTTTNHHRERDKCEANKLTAESGFLRDQRFDFPIDKH